MLKEPKDLGIKIATKEAAWWIRVKENIEKAIENNENELKMNKYILPFVEKQIEKFK